MVMCIPLHTIAGRWYRNAKAQGFCLEGETLFHCLKHCLELVQSCPTLPHAAYFFIRSHTHALSRCAEAVSKCCNAHLC